MPDPLEPQPTRRSFLDYVLGLSVVGFAASLLYPVIRYLKPIQTQGAAGPVRLTREEIVQLERDRFVILRAGPRRLLVLEDSSQKLHALDAKCTHEGCTVQFVPGESVVWCACHNGRFDLDGRVISGPPPRPLDRFGVHRDDTGVVVTLEKA